MKAARTMAGPGLVLPAALAALGFLTMSAAILTLMRQDPEDQRTRGAQEGHAKTPGQPSRSALPPPLAPPPQPPVMTEPVPQAQLDCPPLLSVRFAASELRAPRLPAEPLRQLRDWLDEHPRAILLVQGHADARGGSRYNWELSYRRAHTVLQSLLAAGIPRARMTAQALGAFQPLTGRSEIDGANRRVTLSVLGLPACSTSAGEMEVQP